MFNKIIAAAIAVCATINCAVSNVSAETETRFIECQEWADISDVVAIARVARGDNIAYGVRYEYIRFDANCDGEITNHDADLWLDYVTKYDMFDAVFCKYAESQNETEYVECLSNEFGVDTDHVLIGGVASQRKWIRADRMEGFNHEYVVVERVVSIADGGRTGYAIQEDPYCGDIIYDTEYAVGDIVVIYNTYINGNNRVIAKQEEVMIGNVSELGYTWSPSPEIVERALRNIG